MHIAQHQDNYGVFESNFISALIALKNRRQKKTQAMKLGF